MINEASLRSHLAAGRLVTGALNAHTQIKGCSVDLSVGTIYVPGTEEGKPGSIGLPRSQLTLDQGQTAVVRTLEEVHLATNQACIVFPASAVSLKGLLMTNPGHVDPGYSGHLHVTVINFGSEPYPLLEGGRLLRALFFEANNLATTPYPGRPSPITPELLGRLSHDFLDVEKRATSSADKAVERADRRTKILAVGAPALVAIITIAANWYYTNTRVEERMGKVEALVPMQSRVQKLEMETLKSVEQRLEKLEEAAKLAKVAKRK